LKCSSAFSQLNSVHYRIWREPSLVFSNYFLNLKTSAANDISKMLAEISK
jgi:hypothetical protein